MNYRRAAALLLAGAVFAACEQAPTQPDSPTTTPGTSDTEVASVVEESTVPMASVMSGAEPNSALQLITELELTGSPAERLAQVNAALLDSGARVQIKMAETVTGPGSMEAGQTVFAADRELRLDSKWVPNDPRREADGTNITFMNISPFMTSFTGVPGEGAVNSSFATWAGVQCSKLNLVKRAWNGDLNSALLLGPGSPFAADIVTIGFLPGFIFDLVLGPGAADDVLGVTFTFMFLVDNGDGTFGPELSDIDNNGRTDTALKEVWYNDAFLWTNGAGPGIDIETVAFHENGHALELGHFGRVAVNNKKGTLKVSPRAAMNAFILGVLRGPLGTDNGAYCGNWASWPN